VQLALVAALGISVPQTLVTNDAEQVLQFAARHDRCIFKPVQGGAHTRRLTQAHLDPANLASLAYAPLTLQEEVPGTNVRVFLAGAKVFACEVRTSCVDFRDDASPQILRIDVSEQLADWSRSIARALDLRWTGIDWRLTPDGHFVFLEANPSPMFLGFEHATALPLTESLTELLLGESSNADSAS
jgi:glutathione synthase/RimK-type ligase-like ATP-grasp enzyme